MMEYILLRMFQCASFLLRHMLRCTLQPPRRFITCWLLVRQGLRSALHRTLPIIQFVRCSLPAVQPRTAVDITSLVRATSDSPCFSLSLQDEIRDLNSSSQLCETSEKMSHYYHHRSRPTSPWSPAIQYLVFIQLFLAFGLLLDSAWQWLNVESLNGEDRERGIMNKITFFAVSPPLLIGER
jgi:hypothetical protein